jgi:uncharacterized MAPEG superfamily protein
MAIELEILGWPVFLRLPHLFVAASFATHQRGFKWNVGNRDNERKPLARMTARAARANHNFLETFPFFAAGRVSTRNNGSGTLPIPGNSGAAKM